MPTATCTKCGNPYSWRATRGARLVDNPSPCCSAPGKAKEARRKPTVHRLCPKCQKEGLRIRCPRDVSYSHPYPTSPPFGWMWCPRCNEYVIPVRRFDLAPEPRIA